MVHLPNYQGVIMPITLTDGASFDANAHLGDFIVVQFSRAEVERGLIGDALDRLRLISDDREKFCRFENSVAFTFEGYDQDPREVQEIPEVVTFFRTLTEQWPYWLHFIQRDIQEQDQLSLVLKLLNDCEIVSFSANRFSIRFKDMDKVAESIDRLFEAMVTLYDYHGYEQVKGDEVIGRINLAIEKIFGL
jgi:hypothetical protein